MKNLLTPLAFCISIAPCAAQTLLDSIPFPGSNASFWGIHVDSDTIFIGADGPGDIVFMDPTGNTLGNLPTGHTFNHGLIKRPGSFLIAQDYATAGANLFEISLTGAPLNTWTFPPVNGGNSSGIGDLFPEGNAVWYTMYYPDFDNDPFAYAYKWIPGNTAPIDTVPLHGEQPYGIAIKGDTLFYVTDNLNGDQERIYAYDLTNEQDIGWIELPDTPTDNDMSPRGMYYDGELLYLIANRQGSSAFAYQTIYIYSFDDAVGIHEFSSTELIDLQPNPADAHLFVELPFITTHATWNVHVFNAIGELVHTQQARGGRERIETGQWATGTYSLTAISGKQYITGKFVIAR